MIKKYMFILLVAAVFLQQSIMAESENTGGKIFPAGKQTKVELKSKQGNIFIRTWNKNTVEFGFEFESEDSYKNWEMYTEGNTIHIKQRNNRWGGSGDVLLSIPAYVALKASTCGGNVSIQGRLDAALECFSCSGDIDIDDVNGRVELKTSGGNILTRNITGDFALNSAGGDISVGLVKGNGAIGTSGGNIHGKKLEGKASVNTAGGDIRFDELYGEGKVSTAGGDIYTGKTAGVFTFNTAGGDITANAVEGDYRVQTSAGDITLMKISGSVDAKTSAGEITAEFLANKGDSRLMTTYGDITVYVSPKAKLSVQAQVTITGWWNEDDDYADYLSSEFTSASLKRDDKRKKIYGEYKINGGGPNVNVVVNTGSIFIKKSK